MNGNKLRESLDLGGRWHFQVDPFNAGEIAGYDRIDCDVSGWREVTVPAGFDACGPGLATYEGYGWFQRTFTVPTEWCEREIRLHCGAVNFQAAVWLNGHFLGNHPDAFLPFAFPVQQFLHYGAENVLVIRVDGAPRPGEVPGPEHGWRPIGGILREVMLLATDPVHLHTPRIIADIDGSFQVSAVIANGRDTDATAEIHFTLRQADG